MRGEALSTSCRSTIVVAVDTRRCVLSNRSSRGADRSGSGRNWSTRNSSPAVNRRSRSAEIPASSRGPILVSACSDRTARIALSGMASLPSRSAAVAGYHDLGQLAGVGETVVEDAGGGMQSALRFFDSYQMAPSHRFAIALKQSHQDDQARVAFRRTCCWPGTAMDAWLLILPAGSRG